MTLPVLTFLSLRRLCLITLLAVCAQAGMAQRRVTKGYYKSGSIQSVSYYTGKTLNRQIMYYENGKPSSEHNFDSTGQWFGKQIEYFDNGNKKRELYFLEINQLPLSTLVDSVKNEDLYVDAVTQLETNYYLNGKIKSKGVVVNAMRAGLWRFYDSSGALVRHEFIKCLTACNDCLPMQ